MIGDSAEVPFALFFEVSEEVLRARILERAKTSGRTDDNEESLIKRFVTFKTESMPVVTKLEEMGKLRKIDGSRDIDSVYADVKAALVGHV